MYQIRRSGAPRSRQTNRAVVVGQNPCGFDILLSVIARSHAFSVTTKQSLIFAFNKDRLLRFARNNQQIVRSFQLLTYGREM